jgi:hypothetical protein
MQALYGSFERHGGLCRPLLKNAGPSGSPEANFSEIHDADHAG